MSMSSLQCALLGAMSTLALAWPASRQLQDEAEPAAPRAEEESAVQIQFLEIVTPDVEETCRTLATLHGVSFSDPVAELGGGRTAKLKSGGRVSVRAPMHAAEEPVVRPYVLVDDIEAAVEKAQAAGAEFAMLPTEIQGQGRFAIYFQGGIQYGLWEE